MSNAIGRTLVAALMVAGGLSRAPALRARTLDLPIRDAAHPTVPAPAYFGDRLVVRLRPAATRLVRPLAATAVRQARVGLTALDVTVARFDAVLEPEFPAEPAGTPDARDLSAYWLVHLGAGSDLSAALDAFAASPDVAEAAPVAICPLSAVPDDSLYSVAWNLYQPSRRDIHAPEAWNVSTGDTTLPVAIVDSGIIPYHPDLGGTIAGGWGNLWTNAKELTGIPGVDDDGNGYVDDVWGWDWVNLSQAGLALPGEDWRDPDNDPNDFAGHGTAVASVAGGIADNGIGVSGVLWHTRLMALRIGWASPTAPLGGVDMASAAQAIRYATRNGARVINCSFASVPQVDLAAALHEAKEAGVVVVCAAGNFGSPQYLGELPEVIAVGATDEGDVSPVWSNRGTYVDLSAPGVDLFAAIVKRPGTDSLGVRQPGYAAGAAGTSFAAPQVAAAAALLQADRRARGLSPLSVYSVQMRLRETSDDISAVNTIPQYGDGRLDLARALGDPPTSFATPIGVMSSGSGLVVRSERGVVRLALPTRDGRIVMIDPLTGDTLRSVRLPAAATGPLVAADLGQGRGDAFFVALEDGRIASLDEHFAPRAGWPVTVPPVVHGDGAQLALGDLDGDGSVEVVWGGSDGQVHAWDAGGARRAGFPRPVGVAGNSLRIALGDLDGVAGLEIVAAHPGGTVYALRGDGSSLSGWPVQAWADPVAPLVVRFRAGDPPRVVVAAGNHIGSWGPDARPATQRNLQGLATAAPATGDVNGDGVQEVVVAEGTDVRTLDATLGLLNGTTINDLVGAAPGEPLIGPLGSAGSLALLITATAPTVSPYEVLFDPNGAQLRFDKPGHPGAYAVLDDVDGDGRTEVFTGAGADSAVFVYDAGPTTWRVDRAQWPLSRGNPARTGSRLGAPALALLDDAAPLAVEDLAAAALEAHRATLTWSAPLDSGGTGRAARYEVRRATVPLDEGSFANGTLVPSAPAPDSASRPQQIELAGLDESTTYHVALRSFDANGNASALSNDATFATLGAPPGSVRDLRVAAGNDTAVTLRWTAPADDGALGRPARYIVHAARTPLDEGSFEGAERAWTLDARAAAGAVEARDLGGFAVGERWWFMLRSEDAKGNRSASSNLATALTGPLAERVGVALTAAANPAHAPVSLYWQGASEALGREQRVKVYDLTGRAVRTLAVGRAAAGVTQWDGRDDGGSRLPAGLYFARLESGAFHGITRIVLLR